ncbi:MAG: thiamine pyrophosphate-binding protein [Coxiellaceae bacterium]|nr:thiamine pyrophosphate-binding protein [Coxiellaceae bacterium]
MKLSNFVADYLAKAGMTDVFMLTGGGAMHLNDAFGKHPKLKTTFMHHEQACAMAAESYARLTQKPAILNVTTGPGGINTINGVFGAWTDSIPMIVISGQVRYDTTLEGCGIPNLRQMGDQECDIVRMVSGITKYAVMIKDSNEILYHLQKAVYLATYGRPGPVWLDIPMNIQGATIDENNLKTFNPADIEITPEISLSTIKTIIEKIKLAERPVIMVGSGIRVSGSYDIFLKLLDQLRIPVVTAWNAHDALYDAHPNYSGRPGSVGDRSGNFTVQNSDLLLILGSRLNIRQISYNWQSFGREAYKIMVDIDSAELQKPTLKIDCSVHADLKQFIHLLLQQLNNTVVEKTDWLSWCQLRREKYPVVLPEYWENKDIVNPYCFMKSLSESLPDDQIVVTGDGTACVTAFQSFEIKKETRLYTNSGSASMGYDIPAAIGACVASGEKKIVCLAGDGSAMQNIQELAAIAFKKYPIKIFLLNNQGYHSIRQTQQNFFGEPFVGVGQDSGLGFPNFEDLAKGFGIAYTRCENHDGLNEAIQKTLNSNEPHFCEVMLTLTQQFSPKLSSKRLTDGRMVTKPLEDMSPFLSTEELESNMIIPVLAEV